MGASRSQVARRIPTVTQVSGGACLISVDAGGGVCRWTKAAEVVFGYTSEHAEGMHVEQLVPFLSDRTSELEGWCRRVDGSVFRGLVSSLSAAEHTDMRSSSEPCQVLVVTDITSRYMREQASQRVRERIDEVVTSVAHLAFFSINYLHDELEMWGAFADVIGLASPRPPQHVSELLQLVHFEDREAVSEGLDHTIATGAAFEVEVRVNADLGERWLLLAGSLVDGPCPRIVGAGLNVTRQRSVDEALRVTEGRLHAVLDAQRRVLESKVLEASEQLQRQIGQDLHDGLGQLLTGTAFLAKGLQHNLASEHQQQAQRIVELINLAIARVRSLARGLSPIHVEARSLEAVLRSTLSEASELLGVSCELELVDYIDNAQPSAIAQLCLIAREAITNAVRHGHAQRIVVRLSRAGVQSVLSVEDDGVGIGDIDKPLEGLGLRSMRYRAKMIDGNLDIVRTRSGTTVQCSWSDP
jgi:signal transduction histidine kinase